MKYKRKYTKAEARELCEWFAARMDKLPEKMRLSEAALIKDLPTTVRHYLEIVRLHGDNPTYSGQVYQLFLMRDKLRDGGAD